MRRRALCRLGGATALIGALILAGFAAAETDAQTVTTLAMFNGSNGIYPQGSLTLAGSRLYGSTDGDVFSLPVTGG